MFWGAVTCHRTLRSKLLEARAVTGHRTPNIRATTIRVWLSGHQVLRHTRKCFVLFVERNGKVDNIVLLYDDGRYEYLFTLAIAR
jgi:hypothetical protein